MIRRLLLSFITLVCVCTSAMADTDITDVPNTLYFSPTTVVAGKSATVSVKMKNSDVVQSIGTFFYLSDGLKVASDDIGLLVLLSTERTNARAHSVGSNYIEEDKEYRMYVLQSGGKQFSGNDGEVFTIEVEADKDLAPGDYTLKFAETEFSNSAAPMGILANHIVFEGTIKVVADPTGVAGVNADDANAVEDVYTADGIKTGKIQKGFNLIKQKNGEVIKVAK